MTPYFTTINYIKYGIVGLIVIVLIIVVVIVLKRSSRNTTIGDFVMYYAYKKDVPKSKKWNIALWVLLYSIAGYFIVRVTWGFLG